jgi:hypothetical protein
MANDVHLASATLSNVSGAGPFPLLYLPAEFGAISIKDAYVVGDGAGTSIGLALISISDAGTPSSSSGTVGAFAGTVVYAANARFACTVATPSVSGGNWIGLQQTSGTVPAHTHLVFSYVVGK